MSTRTATSLGELETSAASDPERELPPAIHAEAGHLEVRGVGGIGYYRDVAGANPAIVLIHSINAAASAYEMRPLFEAFRGRRRVFALDLPGFGRSQRGDREYRPGLYADAIERFIVDVASPQGDPIDAVALSLSSEFLARVAVRAPELFRSITLISPTGLGPARPGGRLVHGALDKALGVGALSSGLFRLLRSEASIRHYLKKSFVGSIDEGLARYAMKTSAVPGARFAPVAFLRGALFTPDALRSLYEPLKVPTRVVFDQDPYTRFDKLEELTRSNPRVSAHRVAPSLGMPQFDRTGELVSLIEQQGPGAGASP